MRPSRCRRAGVIYLEIQVALVVLGIGLAGLCPLVVMQLKLLRKLESPDRDSSTPRIIRGIQMLDGQPNYAGGSPVPMLVQPQSNAWARRLGLSAAMGPVPTVLPSPSPSPPPSQQLVAVNPSSVQGWTQGPYTSATGNVVWLRSTTSTAPGPASWDLTDISPGYYKVVATWPGDPINAKDATYKLNGGGGLSATPAQQDQSADPQAAGLGVFPLDTTLHVELNVSATGRVVADAIRIVPRNKVSIRRPLPPLSPVFQVTVEVSPQ